MPTAATVISSRMRDLDDDGRALATSGSDRRCRHLLTCQALERQDLVEDLLAIGRLLDFGDAAAPAIGDAGLGDALVGNGVVRRRCRTGARCRRSSGCAVSALTRTSCEPLIIRLPLGSTSVTTAATSRSMLSERAVAPSPGSIDLEPALPSPAPPVPTPSHSAIRPRPSVRLAVRLRSDSFLKRGPVVDLDLDGQDVARRAGRADR